VAAPPRRRRVGAVEEPLVVVAPDGEVLSAERDLTGGEYSAAAPGPDTDGQEGRA
jgi:hypothetical protein